MAIGTLSATPSKAAFFRERNIQEPAAKEDVKSVEEMVTPNMPPFDYSKERALADTALKAIENNLTALNISREWLEQHIQQVQKGLSSIQRKTRDEVAKVREERLTSQHDSHARRA